MDKFASLVISGVVTGAIYSLIASGLTLTYATSGIFNFAHGAIAFVTAVVYLEVNQGLGWPIVPSVVVAVFLFAPLLGLALDYLMFSHLARAPESARIVGTVGLVIAMPSIAIFLVARAEKDLGWGVQPLDLNQTDPAGIGPNPPNSWRLFEGVGLNSDQLAVLISAAVMAVVLWYVVRRTTLGLRMRATVDRPLLATLRGVNTNQTSRAAWVLGMVLAGTAGVVAAPLPAFLFDQNNYTLLLIVSATAAIFGRLRSIPLAFAGGLLLGVTQNLVQGYFDNLNGILPGHWRVSEEVPGLRSSAPFILLFVGLFVLGRDESRRASSVQSEVPPPDYLADLAPWRRRVPWLVLAIFLVLYTTTLANSIWQEQVARGLALALIFLSFTIVTGIGGMVSLAQTAFVVTGALTAGILFDHGWPFIPAVVVGATAAMLIGVVVALPALRLGGVPLALSTLALAFIGFIVVFEIPAFNNNSGGWDIPRPEFLGMSFESDASMAMLLLVLVGLTAWVIDNLQRSATGRAMVAVRTAELAAATVGHSPVASKLVVFALSAFVAGVGGVLLESVDGTIFSIDYYPLIGLIWITVVVTFGIRRPGAAIVAGLISQTFPRWLDKGFHTGDIESLGLRVFGWHPSVDVDINVPDWEFFLPDVVAALLVLQIALPLAVALGRGTQPPGVARSLPVLAVVFALFLGAVLTDGLTASVLFWLGAAVLGVAALGFRSRGWPGRAVFVGLGILPVLVGVDGDTWTQLPLILFGLGAVNLARKPDGVLAVVAEGRHEARKLRLARAQAKADAEAAAAPAAALEAIPSEAREAKLEVVAAEEESAIAAEVERHAEELVRGGVVRTDAETATERAWVAPGEAALALEGIRAGYGEVGVLHAVDLVVPQGSIVALLGANGAGKSTLCAVAAGSLAPSAGRVLFRGEDVTEIPAHERARKGVVLAPEQRGIFASLTVRENLELWLPEPDQIDEAYERFPILGERRRLAAGSLSGGEQQILTLAPLLVRPPDVLVADEPTLGLAPLVVDQIVGIVRELRERGVSLLLVEEKARDVLEIADVVAFLELGHVVWVGPRAEVDDERLAAAYLGATSV